MQMWRTKRALSESDCDDSIYPDDSKDCSSPGEGVSESCIGASGSGHGMTRKRRRGIIEKRRRDRINHSLSELRRLVPSAFEKQGSAKLEKAEILQLTVDHLKMLHAKGLDALAYDPHKFAMDYHTIGFRECAAEVARYLVTVEGMDVQDPLRLRLMSHLQCFATQRELANKAQTSSGSNGWPLGGNAASYGTAPANSAVPIAPHFANSCPPSGPAQVHHHSQSGFDQGHHLNYMPAAMASGDGTNPTMTPLQPVVGTSSSVAHYPHVNHHPFPSLAAQNSGYAHAGSAPSQPGGGVKPYRPWGAELAY